MKFCSDGHKQICYHGDICPCCEIIDNSKSNKDGSILNCCDNDHEKIWFLGETCPCCEMNNSISDLEKDVRVIDDELTNAYSIIRDFEAEYGEM